MASNSIGTAWIQIKPSLQGISADITKELEGVGVASGKKMGSAISGNLASVGWKEFSSRATSAWDGFINGAKIAAVAATGILSVGLKNFIGSASELQGLRASFESLTGSIESTNSVMNTLYDYGKKTAFDNKSIQASSRMFLSAGVAVEDLMGWLSGLGDLAGTTGADLQGLALPLTQAIGRGKLQTQDWYQIVNQGASGLQKYIVQALGAGHSTQTFADDLSAGAVNVDALRNALVAANAEGGIAFQGAIKQSMTFAGRMSNLQESVTNVGLAILGVNAATGEVDPSGIFAKLSDAVSQATEWLEQNKASIVSWVNGVVDAVGGVLKWVAENKELVLTILKVVAGIKAFMIVSGGFLKLRKELIDIKDVFRGGFSKIPGIVGNVGKAFSVVGKLIAANPIVAAIMAVVGILTFLQLKFNIFGKLFEWLGGVFGAIGSFIGDVVGGIVGFFQKLWDVITGIATVIANIFKPVIDIMIAAFQIWWSIVSKIVEIFAKIGEIIFTVVVVALQALWNAIVTIFSPVVNFFGGVFQGAFDIIIGIFGAIGGFFAGVWNGIIDIFSPIVGWFGGIFQGAWDAITSVFANVGAFFVGIWNTITSIFSSIGTAIGDAVSGAFKSVVNAILGFIEGFINAPIKAINALIGAINWIPGINIGKLDELKLPRMNLGGIVEGLGGIDKNPTLLTRGEYVVRESAARNIGYENLDRMNKTGELGGNGGLTVIFEQGSLVVNGADSPANFADEVADMVSKRIALKQRGVMA